MKTVYKLFHATVLTLCSAIMLSSCDSFLDTKPYDFTAPETFYSNESAGALPDPCQGESLYSAWNHLFSHPWTGGEHRISWLFEKVR